MSKSGSLGEGVKSTLGAVRKLLGSGGRGGGRGMALGNGRGGRRISLGNGKGGEGAIEEEMEEILGSEGGGGGGGGMTEGVIFIVLVDVGFDTASVSTSVISATVLHPAEEQIDNAKPNSSAEISFSGSCHGEEGWEEQL